MSRIAAKTLVTSKGTVRAGADIPKGLNKDELSAIGKAGGFAPDPKNVEPRADTRGDTFKAAVDRVRTAETAFENAAIDDEKKTAETELITARNELFALT